MTFSKESIIGFLILCTGGCLVFLFVWIFNHRRKRIIRLNNVTTGTTVDCIERTGMKGNKYFESVIQYSTGNGQQISARHFNTQKSHAFVKGQQMVLYYDAANPQKFVLKDEQRSRSVNIFFKTVGVLFLIGAICCLLFL